MKKNLIILIVICLYSYSAVAQTKESETIKTVAEKTVEAKVEKKNDKTDEDKKNPGDDSEVPAKLIPTDNKTIPASEEDFAEYLNNSDIEKKSDNQSDLNQSEKEEPPKEKRLDKNEVSVSVSVESLSRGFGTWRTASLFAKRNLDDGKIFWGEYRLSNRRSARDQEIIGGVYYPLKDRYAVTFEGSYSNTNQFVAKYSFRGEVEKVFPKGWVGHLGAWYKYYGPVKVNVLYGEVEKYWGNHRIAYKLNLNSISNAKTSPSNTVTYNKYYGERVNTYGFTLGFGKEEEFVEPTVGVLKTNVFSITGSVKHWINDDFGLSVDATFHRQGEFYYRRGLNFGVRYRF
jgi:YaiO family outer membrane protein